MLFRYIFNWIYTITLRVESILQETESSPTDLKEIPEEIDFKILTESKEKVPVYEAVFEKVNDFINIQILHTNYIMNFNFTIFRQNPK